MTDEKRTRALKAERAKAQKEKEQAEAKKVEQMLQEQAKKAEQNKTKRTRRTIKPTESDFKRIVAAHLKYKIETNLMVESKRK